MKIDLTGKVALVTGGAGGLGCEMVRMLGAAGSTVVVADLNLDEAQALSDEINKNGGKAIAKKLNVTDSANVKNVFNETVQELGSLEILVNSAGITKRLEPLGYPEDVFDKIIDINLKGTFLCSQAAANIMAKKNYGKIVNLTSIGGVVALPNTVAYCSSKGGVCNMTRALALDLAKYQITVNAIAPALTKTNIASTVFANKEELNWFTSRIPLGRLCMPQDVAAAVVFLCSPQSDFITGQVLAVDGGWTCQ